MEVIAANVITADATIAEGDTSLDGSSVVVDAGTLTDRGGAHVQGPGRPDRCRPSPIRRATLAKEQSLALSLTRDLFLACGATIDVSERGYPGSRQLPGGPGALVLLADNFDDGDLAGWQIVDEGELDGPSIWTVTSGAARQRSNIHSDANPGKGTYALWPGPLPSGDYRFSFYLLAVDDDGIGVMFRYVDADNYYRFVWDRQAGSRRLERIADGVVTVLAEDSAAYNTWYWYLVEIVADGPRLSLSIDGAEIFSVLDSTHPSGTVALYAFANTDARFEDVQVAPLTAPSVFSAGSHGGLGGEADGTNFVYGSVYDPRSPGSGGGSLSGTAGGGVVRIAAAGKAVIDGAVRALGDRLRAGVHRAREAPSDSTPRRSKASARSTRRAATGCPGRRPAVAVASRSTAQRSRTLW